MLLIHVLMPIIITAMHTFPQAKSKTPLLFKQGCKITLLWSKSSLHLITRRQIDSAWLKWLCHISPVLERSDKEPLGGGKNRTSAFTDGKPLLSGFCVGRAPPLSTALRASSRSTEPVCNSCASCQSLQLSLLRPTAAVVGSRRPGMSSQR